LQDDWRNKGAGEQEFQAERDDVEGNAMEQDAHAVQDVRAGQDDVMRDVQVERDIVGHDAVEQDAVKRDVRVARQKDQVERDDMKQDSRAGQDDVKSDDAKHNDVKRGQAILQAQEQAALAQYAEETLTYEEPLQLVVTQAQAGQAVGILIQRQLGVSRKLMARLKRTARGITLNGMRVFSNRLVQAGDVIEVRLARESGTGIVPEEMALDVLYEDDYLLVVNKAPGVIVHPTHGHYQGTLANGVLWHWQQRGETVRFRPIHRLDEDTSGVLVIAKNQYVHSRLSVQMQAGDLHKEYTAYVWHMPIPPSGTVRAPIDRNPEEPHKRIVTADGYPSVTHYETLQVYGPFSGVHDVSADGGMAGDGVTGVENGTAGDSVTSADRITVAEGVADVESGTMGAAPRAQRAVVRSAAKVRLVLETGRTHQIRVHMRAAGCPLIGDSFYGIGAEREPVTLARQALHAAQLSLTHPITGERLTFTAPLPADLAQLEEQLTAWAHVAEGE
jgi:23S rRNA pseudouridine1911/1915/1917 synthase